MEPTDRERHAAHELVLYVRTSSQVLYRKQLKLERELGALNPPANLVRACFIGLIDDAASEYMRENANMNAFGLRFTKRARALAVDEMATDYLNGIRRDG